MDGNISRAAEYSRQVAEAGHVPITPHLYLTRFLDDMDPDDRARGIALGLEMLTKCDELWVFGSVRSAGMAAEIEAAEKRGILIRIMEPSA